MIYFIDYHKIIIEYTRWKQFKKEGLSKSISVQGQLWTKKNKNMIVSV